MKYLNTTAIKSFAICCQLILLSSFVQAQKTTNSPYSRYGYGIVNPNQFNSNFGTGGIGYAWRPSVYKPQINDSLARSNAKLNDRRTNFINTKNPASFSNISLTVFETGILSRSTQSTSGSQKAQNNNTTLSHMSVAFPLSSKMGVAFGLRSYSSVGYDYQDQVIVNTVTANNTYEGSGGLNEVFVGTGYEVHKNLSVGVSGKYLFGRVERDKRVVFDSDDATNFFNTIDRSEINYNTFTYDIGVQYFKNINNNYRFVVGLNLAPVSEAKGNESGLIASYTGDSGAERIKDTTLSFQGGSLTTPLASTIGGGFSIERIGEWSFNFDVTSQSLGNETIGDNITLNDATIMNLGIEKFNDVTAFGSYFKRMGYRGGFRYNSSILNVNGTDISEMAISVGLSMPLRKSFSTLNFGMELGTRGEDNNGLTKEDFFNIQFGLTINDKWFIKRKYD